MLDFYLIKDATHTSNYNVSHLDYLGGIDYNEFEELQNEKVIEDDLNYFQDFRWTSEQVTAKLIILERASRDNYKMAEILNKAKDQDSGVIAFCD
jgi:hypothetical protein